VDVLTSFSGTNIQSEPKPCVDWKSNKLELAKKTKMKDIGEMRPCQWVRNSLTPLEISQASTARPYDRSSMKKGT